MESGGEVRIRTVRLTKHYRSGESTVVVFDDLNLEIAPGERVGFHRHVLDYFWTAVSGGRARQHVHDGTTVEYTYAPGETRHETYGKGEFKVHDLENLSDKEMVFMTVEFKDSANQPMALPEGVRSQAAAA